MEEMKLGPKYGKLYITDAKNYSKDVKEAS